MTPHQHSQEALANAVAANTLPHIPPGSSKPSHGIRRSQTCPACNAPVDKLVPMTSGPHKRACLDCYEKTRVAPSDAPKNAAPPNPAQLAERERVTAELGATFFALQRLALPSGEPIAVTLPVEQPRAINATFILDNAMPRILSFEDAYQTRVNVVKRGLPTLHRRGQAQAWEAAA
jgi:hypothetical protein